MFRWYAYVPLCPTFSFPLNNYWICCTCFHLLWWLFHIIYPIQLTLVFTFLWPFLVLTSYFDHKSRQLSYAAINRKKENTTTNNNNNISSLLPYVVTTSHLLLIIHNNKVAEDIASLFTYETANSTLVCSVIFFIAFSPNQCAELKINPEEKPIRRLQKKKQQTKIQFFKEEKTNWLSVAQQTK